MKSPLLNFLALFISTLALMTGIGLLGTYLSLRLTIEGVEARSVGLIMACYYVGMLFGAISCQRLIKQVGHIRSFAVFTAVVSAVVMAHGLFSNHLIWAVLRFIAGVSTIGLYMVIESWLNACTEPHLRGRVFSVYMILGYLGISVGQLLINAGDTANHDILFLVGLMMMLSIIPVGATRSIHPAVAEFQHFGLAAIFRKSPVGMLGCITAGLISGAFYSMGPVFCHKAGFSVTQLSLVMSTTVIGGLLLQWPIGILSDRFDRTYILACVGGALALLAASAFYTRHVPHSIFLAIMALFGGLMFTIYPVSVARAHDIFKPDDIVQVSAALLLFYSVGATSGPILVSTWMSVSATPYSFFTYCSAVSGVCAALVFFLRKMEIISVVPAEESTQFVVMQNTSPVIVLMDPRIDEAIPADLTDNKA